jgi:hypothetical protein
MKPLGVKAIGGAPAGVARVLAAAQERRGAVPGRSGVRPD